MTNNADTTIEILPIEQSQLQIELKIYEKLLKLFYECSNLRHNNSHNILEFDVNKVLPYLLKEVSQLKTELSKYKTKAPITKPPSSVDISGLSL